MLSEKPAGTNSFPSGHYLVPDTNALLNGMDLFEQNSGFYDIIVLQTVLEELRNRSLPLYNRIIGLTKSDDKHVYVFFNDFRLETYIVREPAESINDRNDRAVRRAVKWYGDHLQEAIGSSKAKKQCPIIIMLSDDKDNLRKAKADNISACSLSEYVSGLDDADRLLDMINVSRQGQEARSTAAEQLYPGYFSLSKMMTGMRAETLHQGIFNVSPLQLP